jgi:DNA-directed RNA polymerase subunit RPC12/RpoP
MNQRNLGRSVVAATEPCRRTLRSMIARRSYPLRALLIGRCTSLTGTRISSFRNASAVSKVPKQRLCSPIGTQSNEVNPHKCGYCERSFATREALDQHMNAQHAKQISCPACGATRFRSLTGALQHLESGQCPQCQGKKNARYQVYQAISPHIGSSRRGEPQWLLVGSAVVRGVQNADELEEFPYRCDGCDRKFRELNHLLQHNTDKHMGFLWALQQQQQQQLGKPPTMMPLRFVLLPNHDNNDRQHNESHEIHDDNHDQGWDVYNYDNHDQGWDDYNDLHDDDD